MCVALLSVHVLTVCLTCCCKLWQICVRHPENIFIEYGAETAHDSTLSVINRCHTWSCTVDAVRRTASAGFPVGVHLILGLPGESIDMMLETVDRINGLPVDTVKFHQLQVLVGTCLAAGQTELNLLRKVMPTSAA